MKFERKKKIIVIIILLVILLIIGLFSFFYNKSDNQKEISNFDKVTKLDKEDEAKAAKIIKENIVRVINKVDDYEIVGTGFFLSNGYLLTNSHNIDIEGKITIEYYNGEVENAEIYSNSIDLDIALLKVESPKVKYMELADTTNIEVTNSVLAAGYAFNFKGEASITKGSISAFRSSGILNYIQSDISMNRGNSGGPLFNSKAEIIGMNTFASDNGNIGISIRSESIIQTIDMLLKEPQVNYLITTRPANPINDILVNIGYTDDSNYELYDDKKVVKYVVEKNGGNLEENDAKIEYYCDEGYELNGSLCVKEEKYAATKVKAKCPEGFTENATTREGNISCVNLNLTDGTPTNGCKSGWSREGDMCVREVEGETSAIYSEILGNCPTGKKCYEIGKTSIKVSENITCPSESITEGIYILSGEENKEENYKRFVTSIIFDTYAKIKNQDGKYKYVEHSPNPLNCVKEDLGNVKIIYTKSELESMNVCNGSKLVKYNNGYYCLTNETLINYAYDAGCEQESTKLSYNNNKLICKGKIKEKEYHSYVCKCPSGLEISERYDENNNCKDACWKEEEYIAKDSYQCNENDILSGKECIKRIFTSAKIK